MKTYLCVYDSDLCEELLREGAKLINKQNSINGETVWTMSLGSLHFDIQDEKYRGKCNLTNRLTMTF